MTRMLITGGAGFIGSHFVDYMLAKDNAKVTVLDKLTYAAKLSNLYKATEYDNFVQLVTNDICSEDVVDDLVRETDIVVNFAAESHVDRSIANPSIFVQTNVLGTQVLLNAALKYKIKLFVQISTDEVYGSLISGYASERSPLNPTSPYSASKASAELLCLAAHKTYGLPVIITRGSNTFGPRQYPEKLLPVLISNCIKKKPLPIYADGKQRRDWLYVEDHCEGIYTAITKGTPGEIYNVGGGVELENIELARYILSYFGLPDSLIEHVKDRPAHDFRYAMNCHKLDTLGWRRQDTFFKNLNATIDWYRGKK